MNQDEGVNDFALVFCISFFNNRYAYNLMSCYLPKKRSDFDHSTEYLYKHEYDAIMQTPNFLF